MKNLVNGGHPGAVTDNKTLLGARRRRFFAADDDVTNPVFLWLPDDTATQGGTDNFFNSGDMSRAHQGSLHQPERLLHPVSSGPGRRTSTDTTSRTTATDNLETNYGPNGRDIFRGPFQTRFDFSVFKTFKFGERFGLKLQADAFNLFNHASFDALQ